MSLLCSPCPAPGIRGSAADGLPGGGTPVPSLPVAGDAVGNTVTGGGGQELTCLLSLGERTVFKST